MCWCLCLPPAGGSVLGVEPLLNERDGAHVTRHVFGEGHVVLGHVSRGLCACAALHERVARVLPLRDDRGAGSASEIQGRVCVCVCVGVCVMGVCVLGVCVCACVRVCVMGVCVCACVRVCVIGVCVCVGAWGFGRVRASHIVQVPWAHAHIYMRGQTPELSLVELKPFRARECDAMHTIRRGPPLGSVGNVAAQ